MVITIPQYLYFVMYCAIFWRWFTISHSITSNDNENKEQLRKVIFTVHILLWVIFAMLFGLTFMMEFAFTTNILSEITLFVTCVLLLLTAMMVIYAMIQTRDLYGGHQMAGALQSVRDIHAASLKLRVAAVNWKRVNKQLMKMLFITFYFLLHLGLSAYLLSENEEF